MFLFFCLSSLVVFCFSGQTSLDPLRGAFGIYYFRSLFGSTITGVGLSATHLTWLYIIHLPFTQSLTRPETRSGDNNALQHLIPGTLLATFLSHQTLRSRRSLPTFGTANNPFRRPRKKYLATSTMALPVLEQQTHSFKSTQFTR